MMSLINTLLAWRENDRRIVRRIDRMRRPRARFVVSRKQPASLPPVMSWTIDTHGCGVQRRGMTS